MPPKSTPSADGIAALRPGLDVREAYVDVQEPELPAVVAGLPAGETAVVVPLLLSVGYHVKVDIARAVKSRPDTRAAAPLGPDPRLAALLDQRLREAGVTDNDAVILAAAGSSDPNAAQNVEELVGPAPGAAVQPDRGRLRCLRQAFGPRSRGHAPRGGGGRRRCRGIRRGSGPGRPRGHRLLSAGPGFFHDQLAKAGADLVTAPLLPSPVLAEIALERYDAALAAGHPTPVTHSVLATARRDAQRHRAIFKARRRFVTKCFPR